jgi:sphinganine-1-phosphate aldolase
MPINLDEVVPWVVGAGFVLTRLHLFRELRRILPATIATVLIWRCLNEQNAVDILSYISATVARLVPNASLRMLIQDTLGALLLCHLVAKFSKNLTFNLIELKIKYGNMGFDAVKWLPVVVKKMEKEKKEMEESLEVSLKAQCKTMGEVNLELPSEGKAQADILRLMTKLARNDDDHWKGGKVSGSVYLGDSNHAEFLNKVFGLYSMANPLHPAIWPSLMKFESEIISMVANMMSGGRKSVVGCVTSGGTESIVLAIKTHRDYHRAVHGVTEPELVACISAHAAVNKGCELLGVKLVQVPMDENYRVDLGALERAIGPNTIMMYSSAPSFPQGVIDPISKMSDIALKYGIGLHVDCCLGGFILPFARKLGYNIPGIYLHSSDCFSIVS